MVTSLRRGRHYPEVPADLAVRLADPEARGDPEVREDLEALAASPAGRPVGPADLVVLAGRLEGLAALAGDPCLAPRSCRWPVRSIPAR